MPTAPAAPPHCRSRPGRMKNHSRDPPRPKPLLVVAGRRRCPLEGHCRQPCRRRRTRRRGRSLLTGVPLNLRGNCSFAHQRLSGWWVPSRLSAGSRHGPGRVARRRRSRTAPIPSSTRLPTSTPSHCSPPPLQPPSRRFRTACPSGLAGMAVRGRVPCKCSKDPRTGSPPS